METRSLLGGDGNNPARGDSGLDQGGNCGGEEWWESGSI